MAAQLLYLVALLAVSSLGPGFLFVRRLRLGPLEKLCAALGLSLVLVYLASFVIFALHLPAWWHPVVSVIGLAMTLWCGRDLLRLLAERRVRRVCAGYGLLAGWVLLLLALVRHFSGGEWSFDWLEHYERTLYFLQPERTDFRFLRVYPVPSRPPLMNVLAGHFLSQAGTRYELYEVLCTILNLLVFFPLALIGPSLAPRGRFPLPVLLGLLMACPMVAQNATFSWTKLFSAFYVLLAVAFYLRGWSRGDRVRLMIAFTAGGAGLLVHFSAGPYLLFLGLHYLLAVFPRRPAKARELAIVFGPGAALLAGWFFWSAAVYGAGTTFGSNTTASSLRGAAADAVAEKVARNLYDTLVPHPLRIPEADMQRTFVQPSSAGYLRDYVFVLYQTNLIAALGSVGGIVVLVLLAQTWRRSPDRRRVAFWIGFVIVTTVVGVAAHPTRDRFGVAHICGQPAILLGVTFLAARFLTLPRLVRWLVLAGCGVDFALGILLHFHLEHRVFNITMHGGRSALVLTPETLSDYAAANYADRLRAGTSYLGDHFLPYASLIEGLVVLVFLAVVIRMVQIAARGGVR